MVPCAFASRSNPAGGHCCTGPASGMGRAASGPPSVSSRTRAMRSRKAAGSPFPLGSTISERMTPRSVPDLGKPAREACQIWPHARTCRSHGEKPCFHLLFGPRDSASGEHGVRYVRRWPEAGESHVEATRSDSPNWNQGHPHAHTKVVADPGSHAASASWAISSYSVGAAQSWRRRHRKRGGSLCRPEHSKRPRSPMQRRCSRLCSARSSIALDCTMSASPKTQPSGRGT